MIYILDQYSQIYTSDSSSVATLSPSPDSPPGALSLSGNRVVATNGLYNFSEVVVRMQPGAQAALSLGLAGISTFGNPIPQLEAKVNITVETRKCAVGEALTEDNRCLKCDSRSFLQIAPSEPTSCKPCPFEAVCFGGSTVLSAPGYWRWTNTSEDFIKCHNPEACLGGTFTEPSGVCAPGYTGIVCANCINGYRKSAPFTCSTCPTIGLNSLYLIILMGILLFFVILLVRANMHQDASKSPLYSILLKIIVSHFQILGIIMSINFSWPSQLQSIQDGYAYFSGLS